MNGKYNKQQGLVLRIDEQEKQLNDGIQEVKLEDKGFQQKPRCFHSTQPIFCFIQIWYTGDKESPANHSTPEFQYCSFAQLLSDYILVGLLVATKILTPKPFELGS